MGIRHLLLFQCEPGHRQRPWFEVPNRAGIQLHDILTVSLGGVGTIEHVVNDTGATANTANQVVDLVSYP